ncbi:MAG: cyclophilin-like fold protein [Methylophilus sp.]
MGNVFFTFKYLVSYMLSVLIFCSSAYSEEISHPSVQPSSRSDTTMQIRIEIEGQKPVMATLDSSPATLDLIKQLPLTLELSDYAGIEKIAYPPHKLSTQHAAKAYAGKAGDITYYAPWGNLAIFYRDSDAGLANGLIYLGKLASIPAAFSKPQKITIRITAIK